MLVPSNSSNDLKKMMGYGWSMISSTIFSEVSAQQIDLKTKSSRRVGAQILTLYRFWKLVSGSILSTSPLQNSCVIWISLLSCFWQENLMLFSSSILRELIDSREWSILSFPSLSLIAFLKIDPKLTTKMPSLFTVTKSLFCNNNPAIPLSQSQKLS